MLKPVLEQLAHNHDAALARLEAFLAIPSVSTDPNHTTDIRRAANWLGKTLPQMGLQTRIHTTKGHPILVAKSHGDDVLNPNAPHVLFYGHYDVQPPDPLDQWTTPPFEPAIRNNAIYARGASDDKGQLCTILESLRAWKVTHGKFPVHVTCLIEGEEECGSEQLPAFINSHREELASDIAITSDTTMWDIQTIAITYGLRGVVYFDVQLHNATRDLHSGVYGGALANPATILTGVLGGLFDNKHRVTIPGFYDDVLPVTDEEHRRWLTLNFDETSEYFDPIGIKVPFGEDGYSTLERRWARPACDINGLYGGYGGEGAKTVIPSFAGAKVSFRTAPNQVADKIAHHFTSWLTNHDTHGCQWKIKQFGSCDPIVLPTDSAYITAACRACKVTSGREPALVREGATLPIVIDFKKTLGVDTLLIGFGLSDDCIHAPNEKLNLDCFNLGCRTHAALLGELATFNGPMGQASARTLQTK